MIVNKHMYHPLITEFIYLLTGIVEKQDFKTFNSLYGIHRLHPRTHVLYQNSSIKVHFETPDQRDQICR